MPAKPTRRRTFLRAAPWAAALLLLAATRAGAGEFTLGDGQAVVGAIGIYVTRYEDTLLDLARRFDLGFTQLVAANRGIDPWLPGSRQVVVLPDYYLVPRGERRGIVVDLGEQRLYYFPPGGGRVETYPIGVAVLGRVLPLGTTTVVGKTVNPTWRPPPSIRAEEPELPAAVPPGPDNPLGEFALRLGWSGYLIHGTNKPDGIGRNVSHGCVHLYPEDIARLFAEVPIGTEVRVVRREMAMAWRDDRLFIAIHPSHVQTEALDIGGSFRASAPPNLVARVAAEAGDRKAGVDWAAVRLAGRERTGLPVGVTMPRLAAIAAPSR